MVAVLAACADEPAAPKSPSALQPAMSVPPTGEFVEVTVTNASGGTEVGSLRWAVSQIGSAGGAIHFDPALAGGTITLGAPLDIEDPTYIVGPDSGITLSGNDQHRVIRVDVDARVSLTNVTVTKGFAADYGSAIEGSSVYLQNSTVQDNRGQGSAIRVLHLFSAVNSTISRNVVGGPAVEYSQYAQVFFDNSTVAYNAPGAGIGLYGPIEIGHSLLVLLNNSIISNNGSPLQNCTTTAGMRYEGTNIANDLSCGNVGIGFGDPQLLPLARNGGPTMTHAIPHTSPAYNSGVGCYVETDQRYVARDAKCDVGAFEFNDFTKVTITINPTVKMDLVTGRAVLTGTIKCTRAESFRLALELHQTQKVGKQVVDVHAASDVPVSCITSPTAWGAALGLAPGEAFKAGAARATAQTFQSPEWVAPASAANAVKVSLLTK
jgi:hypothetical protein